MIDKKGPSPRDILTPRSLHNAFRVLLAIGGSTNAVIHLAALAGRLGINIDYSALDKLGRQTPVLVDLKPSGSHYMEDLNKAGGLAPVLKELSSLLYLDCLTVTGESLGEILEKSLIPWPQNVVKRLSEPIYREGGIAVLHGNIAPDGAIIKHSAATRKLLKHIGRAVVFESLDDLSERIDNPDLDVTADDILVLRNAGPKGAPGMPEAGYIPIPKKLAKEGVKDMVRISDARMSGTAFGTIVLHVCPEAAIGGALAVVKNGDQIALDVENRQLNVLISNDELESRVAAWKAPPPHLGADRGWLALHLSHVQQANRGCDFDFLSLPPNGSKTPTLC
jgi:dihydroxy-acid dehydratase